VLYLLLFGIGTSAVPWTINAEIYPMPVRSLCMGIGVACNWTANLLVAYTFLSLEDTISSAGTFWLYGGAAALGTVRLACAWPNPPTPNPHPGRREPEAESRTACIGYPMKHSPSPAAGAAYTAPGVGRTHDARDRGAIARGYPAPLCMTSRARLARRVREREGGGAEGGACGGPLGTVGGRAACELRS